MTAALDSRGKVGKKAFLEKWLTSIPPLFAGESVFQVNFTWEDGFGFPGAFFIQNGHTSEFFLKSLTLEDVPGYGRVHFDCNSWVYPSGRYKKDRIFFANNVSVKFPTNPLKQSCSVQKKENRNNYFSLSVLPHSLLSCKELLIICLFVSLYRHIFQVIHQILFVSIERKNC